MNTKVQKILGDVPTIDGPEVRWIEMTPDLAKKLLALNGHNRPLTDNRSEQYKADLLDDAWKPEAATHVGVSVKGGLINGQHQLTAVALSGVTMRMLVMVDVPEDAWMVFDNNSPRRLDHELAREGIKSASQCAAATKGLWQISKGYQIGGRETSSVPTRYKLWQERKEEILRHASDAKRIASAGKSKFGSPGSLLTLMVMAYEADPQEAPGFFFKMENGPYGDHDEQIKRLRTYLDAQWTSARKSRRGMDIPYNAAMTILAFNAWREGDHRRLVWRRGGANPQPFPRMLTAEEIVVSGEIAPGLM